MSAPSKTEHHRTVTRQAWVSIGFVLLGIMLAPIRIRVLTHALTEAEYGIFNLLTLTVASIGFVALLGQRQYLVFALPGKNKKEQGAYFHSSLWVTLISGIVFTVLFLVCCRFIPLLTTSFSPLLVAIGAVFIVLYALANFGMGYLLAIGEVIRYRLQVFLISNLWMIAILPIAFWGGLALTHLAWFWIAGLAIPMIWLAKWSWTFLADGRASHPRIDIMRNAVGYGFPLISRNVANSLMRLADRYVILNLLGAADVGLYTVPTTLVSFAADTQYFLEFFFPHISARWRANREAGRPGCSGEASAYFHMALRICLLTTVPMCIGILLWGNPLVRVLAGSSYASVSFLFSLLVAQVILIPMTHFIHFALMLDNRTYLIGYSIVGTSIFNVALNLVLIPRMGLAGAAMAGTVSYFVLVAVSLWMGRLWAFLQWRDMRIVQLALTGAAMAGAILLCRAFLDGATWWEVPAAGTAFLAVGHGLRLWTRRELEFVFGKRKDLPPS